MPTTALASNTMVSGIASGRALASIGSGGSGGDTGGASEWSGGGGSGSGVGGDVGFHLHRALRDNEDPSVGAVRADRYE